MVKLSEYRNRRDAEGNLVWANRRYPEAKSATEATWRNRWMHSQFCREWSETNHIPTSECDGTCMFQSRDFEGMTHGDY